MVYKFFDKKTSNNMVQNEIMPNKELALELKQLKHKPIIRKFKNEKYTRLLQTTFGVLILQLIMNLIEEFFFYYVLLIF